jgi:hypothetical protein
MSAAEKAATKTQQNQSDKVLSFHPAKPEIPSNGLCADAACEANTPPPPPGTEPFSTGPVSVSWLTVVAVASVLFFVITVYKKR